MSENSLSVCIITKDSEKYLRQCLDSVKDIATEIIVLDTGSTDRTKEIALSPPAPLSGKEGRRTLQVPSPQRRGDLGVRLYETIWEDDFSKARNECLTYATSEWILVMDSDQELAPESIGELRKALQDKNKLAYYVTIEIPNGKSIKYLRLFRNNYGIKYKGIIHEQIFQSVNTVLEKFPFFLISDSGIKLIEHGYYDTTQKTVRNTKLLEKALLDNSLDNLSRIYYLTKLGAKLAQTNPERGLNYLNEAVNLAEKEQEIKNYPYIQELFELISLYYLKQADLQRAFNYTKKGLTIFPESATLNFFLACLYEEKNKITEASVLYHKVLDLLNNKTILTAINKKEISELCLHGIKRCNKLKS